MTPDRLVKELDAVFAEANITHPYFESWWSDLKTFVENEFSALTEMRLHTVYEMDTKKGHVTMVVTKENQKTWVAYEVEGSVRPGMRWMLYKSWCTTDNIQRAVSQSYSLPLGVKVK